LASRAGLLGHNCAGPPAPRGRDLSSARKRKRTGKSARARSANPPLRPAPRRLVRRPDQDRIGGPKQSQPRRKRRPVWNAL